MTDTRWKNVKLEVARVPLSAQIATNKCHDLTPIPDSVKIKRLPAAHAWTGSHTWAKKGGMMGGRGGSSRGVTSGNGIGVVPQAFMR